MTDEQFDDLARSALSYEAGLPREGVWQQAKPMRESWLPTVREILLCGAIGALALLVVGVRIERGPLPERKQNPVIRAAMHDETHSALVSVTRIPGLG